MYSSLQSLHCVSVAHLRSSPASGKCNFSPLASQSLSPMFPGVRWCPHSVFWAHCRWWLFFWSHWSPVSCQKGRSALSIDSSFPVLELGFLDALLYCLLRCLRASVGFLLIPMHPMRKGDHGRTASYRLGLPSLRWAVAIQWEKKKSLSPRRTTSGTMLHTNWTVTYNRWLTFSMLLECPLQVWRCNVDMWCFACKPGQCSMKDKLLPMQQVPPLHNTDRTRGTTRSLQFGTSAVAGAARTELKYSYELPSSSPTEAVYSFIFFSFLILARLSTPSWLPKNTLKLTKLCTQVRTGKKRLKKRRYAQKQSLQLQNKCRGVETWDKDRNVYSVYQTYYLLVLITDSGLLLILRITTTYNDNNPLNSSP